MKRNSILPGSLILGCLAISVLGFLSSVALNSREVLSASLVIYAIGVVAALGLLAHVALHSYRCETKGYCLVSARGEKGPWLNRRKLVANIKLAGSDRLDGWHVMRRSDEYVMDIRMALTL